MALSPSQGTYGVDDYPDKDATDCSATFGIYSWCKAGSDLSARKFGYRNCTDFVAWRLGITYASLAFPGGDGNARGWKQGAINSGYQVGTTPVIGAVAWWGTEVGSGYGHIAIVIGVNSDGSARVEQYNKAGTGQYSITPATTADAYLYIGVNPPSGGGGSTADGSFVTYAGNVYRIAGGAPVYVSNWNAVGGPQPTTPLTDTQFASLRHYPADGTFVSTATPNAVYEFAGGAPIYVSTWDAVGGQHPTVQVDPMTLDVGDGVSPFNHIHSYPADGTLVSTATPNAVYEFAGGAPIYVSTWDAVGGQHPTVQVDPMTLDVGDGVSPFNHIHSYPADGTFVSTATPNAVYEFAGGAPIYVSTWDAVGGQHPTVQVDPMTLDVGDGVSPFNHIHSYPADGTFVSTATPNAVYEFAGGAPIYVSTWDAVGGQHPTVQVDPFALNNPDGSTPLNHVRRLPADGTTLLLSASRQVVVFHPAACIPATNSTGAVLIDQSQSPCTGQTTTTLASSLSNSTMGQKGILKASVHSAPGQATATGTVSYVVDGNLVATVSLKKGNASLNLSSLHAGDHQVSVTYSGDASHSTSISPPLEQQVQQANTATTPTTSGTGSKAKVTAVVAAVAPGAGVPTGSVTFNVDGVTSIATLAGGKATIKIGAGSHSITGTYQGNSDYAASSGIV